MGFKLGPKHFSSLDFNLQFECYQSIRKLSEWKKTSKPFEKTPIFMKVRKMFKWYTLFMLFINIHKFLTQTLRQFVCCKNLVNFKWLIKHLSKWSDLHWETGLNRADTLVDFKIYPFYVLSWVLVKKDSQVKLALKIIVTM